VLASANFAAADLFFKLKESAGRLKASRHCERGLTLSQFQIGRLAIAVPRHDEQVSGSLDLRQANTRFRPFSYHQ
jgi:hypothetical protein